MENPHLQKEKDRHYGSVVGGFPNPSPLWCRKPYAMFNIVDNQSFARKSKGKTDLVIPPLAK